VSKETQLFCFFLFFCSSASAKVAFIPDSLTIESIIDSAFQLSKAGEFIDCIDLVEKPIFELEKHPLDQRQKPCVD